jgi:hypothetical protein
VSGFSADWLRLREPADAAARDSSLVAMQTRAAATIIDLGAGAGSNLRYLAPRIGGAQHWTLVDHDATLLAAAKASTAEWAATLGAHQGPQLRVETARFSARVETRELDLARDLAALELPRGALVTSSALLDLVSARWLGELALRCAAAEAPVLFALIYDGRTTCEPAEPEDAEVLALFNRHQLGDKGFGPALGPAAPRATEQAFAQLGYRIETRASDWRLEPREAGLQRALVDGWLGAALEMAPERAGVLRDWHRRRLEHVAHGRSRIVVGHADLAGQPRAVKRSA